MPAVVILAWNVVVFPGWLVHHRGYLGH